MIFSLEKKRLMPIALSIVMLAACTGCGSEKASDQSTGTVLFGSNSQDTILTDADLTTEEMYGRALSEDVLTVYTVSTRVTGTKEVFEKQYPGLCVEIRDLRSPDLIDAIKTSYENGGSDFDVVICNDNSGDFKSTLVDTGIVVPYIPDDIKPKMKEGHVGESVSFLDEAELVFYNAGRYQEQPITNIWEMTDEKYKGRIYLPNPLRSFSTYTFVGATFEHEDEIEKAYAEYFGKDYDNSDMKAAEMLWSMVAKNAVFTNSSDEVLEALNTDAADLGVMVSSKLRFRAVGYKVEPVYRLMPFCGCRTSFAVMIGAGSKNMNAAKLFVRCLLGDADGQGEGYKPFCTAGTWSARSDVPDGNDVPLSDADLITPDQDYLIKNRQYFDEFWTECLRNH
jgi:iron(III) transport system substrate-binding protein